MRTTATFMAVAVCLVLVFGCATTPTSDDTQSVAQEKILAEGTAQTGMPAIKNFRERKLLKDILELRDQTGLVTYSYILCQELGKFLYLGESVGYGIPYAAQYTNPQKVAWRSGGYHYVLPQADPNGLYSPAAAAGTWILLKDPTGGTKPQYVEDNLTVLTFKLPSDIVVNY